MSLIVNVFLVDRCKRAWSVSFVELRWLLIKRIGEKCLYLQLNCLRGQFSSFFLMYVADTIMMRQRHIHTHTHTDRRRRREGWVSAYRVMSKNEPFRYTDASRRSAFLVEQSISLFSFAEAGSTLDDVPPISWKVGNNRSTILPRSSDVMSFFSLRSLSLKDTIAFARRFSAYAQVDT